MARISCWRLPLPIAADRQKLTALFGRVAEIPEDALELRADFAAYLCVRISGHLEKSIKHIYSELSRTQASPSVSGYVAWRLAKLGNVNASVLCELVGKFNAEWRASLEDFIEGPRRAAVDGIIANRHRIAHGEWIDLTYIRVKNYGDSVSEVVDFLWEQCASS